MKAFTVENRRRLYLAAFGSLVGVAFGVLFTASALITDSPVCSWMRVRGCEYASLPDPGELLAELAVMSVGLWIVLAISTAMAKAMLQALLGNAPKVAVVFLVAVITAGGAVIYEAAWGLHGGSGNFYASDASGMTVQDGRLTAHGWETALRRALVAGVTAFLMVSACSVITRRAKGKS